MHKVVYNHIKDGLKTPKNERGGILNMKKLLAFVLALSLLCMGGVALADGETLVIYSARNERLNNIVIPAFEAKTGIKVEMITGSSGEVLQRVKSEVETGNVTVDIHWAADETMLAANRDLFEVYVSTENDALVPLFQNDGTNCFNNAYAEPNVMIVNTKLLAEMGIEVNGLCRSDPARTEGQDHQRRPRQFLLRLPVPDRHALRHGQWRSDEQGSLGLHR